MARRPRTLRGQRPRARIEAPCPEAGRSRVRLRSRWPKAASGSPRAHADDERAREVGQGRSTCEVAEQGRAIGGGGDGGKGPGQGKLARAQRGPDAEPDSRDQRARAGTSSSHQGQETALHRAPASRLRRRALAAGVSLAEARRGRRHRRRDVAALRRESRGQPRGPLRTAAPRSVPSEPGSSRVHPESGRAATAARHSHAGRQDRPACHRRRDER